MKKLALFGLAGIVLLGAFLRFYQLGAASVGNQYYAATVKSMLASGHNFFFAAFEPGGSVTVDKPPLGFWLEAISAFFLGVNGFALALPNALAGTLSIPLLYGLVKKQFGLAAGLSAALVLAVMPVSIATERNNTIDGLLVFFLLLAAWAVWKAVAGGGLPFLLLGALLVGLGFNIKMLQAYMVLPALYALYFFGAKCGWGRRVAHLSLASILLVGVSLSWALVVDSVPPQNRPFIGSSTDNTVMELIFGHNGIKRLLGGAGGGPPPANPLPGGPPPGQLPNQPGQMPNPPGQVPNQPGQVPNPPGQVPNQPGQRPYPPVGAQNQPNRQNEVGIPGMLRLFTEPLASQSSWLLPLALLGSVLALVLLGRPWPPGPRHLALLLWLGWLLPAAVYFSFTTGIWHSYYLIMLGPPLAALVGAAVWALAELLRRSARSGRAAAGLASGITLAFEAFILSAYPAYFAAGAAGMLVLWLAGLGLLAARRPGPALGLLLASLLAGPLLWAGLTSFSPHTDVNLPKAGPVSGPAVDDDPTGTALSQIQRRVLDFLLANTGPQETLAATYDSHSASPYILASGRAMLTFGGFSGADNVVPLARLQELLSAKKLRFVLDTGSLPGKPGIYSWVRGNCRVVNLPGIQQLPRPAVQQPGGGQFSALYDCWR